MFNFIRVTAAALLVTACSNAACAAVRSSSAPAQSARTRLALVTSARAEIAQAEIFTTSDASLLGLAQGALNDSVALAAAAIGKATALAATAAALRGRAYDLTNQPGLSAVQNRKMIAAMEAADAAESAAGAAQTAANLAAGSVDRNREAIVRLTSQIDALQRRMVACTAFIRSQQLGFPPSAQSSSERNSLAVGAAR